jgi:hypothetical protein
MHREIMSPDSQAHESTIASFHGTINRNVLQTTETILQKRHFSEHPSTVLKVQENAFIQPLPPSLPNFQSLHRSPMCDDVGSLILPPLRGDVTDNSEQESKIPSFSRNS